MIDANWNRLWDCKVWGWSSGRICCGVKKTSRCTTQRQRSQVDAIGVWVYSCGSRVNEGEMEKHQEDHAAAMERLYSPQPSTDISFLHCLIVEVLLLLTSKHFFTKPLAQLFGFWSSCLSLLTSRRDDYQKEIRLLTEKHAKEIQGLKEDRCTTEQASHWWWGIEARLCSIVRSLLPLIPRHVLHLGFSLWTFNLSLSLSLSIAASYQNSLSPPFCPRLWYIVIHTLFQVTSLFPISIDWKFTLFEYMPWLSLILYSSCRVLKCSLAGSHQLGVAEFSRRWSMLWRLVGVKELRKSIDCKMRSGPWRVFWDNCDWTCESQGIGQFNLT